MWSDLMWCIVMLYRSSAVCSSTWEWWENRDLNVVCGKNWTPSKEMSLITWNRFALSVSFCHLSRHLSYWLSWLLVHCTSAIVPVFSTLHVQQSTHSLRCGLRCSLSVPYNGKLWKVWHIPHYTGNWWWNYEVRLWSRGQYLRGLYKFLIVYNKCMNYCLMCPCVAWPNGFCDEHGSEYAQVWAIGLHHSTLHSAARV